MIKPILRGFKDDKIQHYGNTVNETDPSLAYLLTTIVNCVRS